MITFNAGAWRPANGQMRAAQLASANDLVTRTLAQHGLTAGPGAGLFAPGGTETQSAALSGLSDRLSNQSAETPSAAAQPPTTCALGRRAP